MSPRHALLLVAWIGSSNSKQVTARRCGRECANVTTDLAVGFVDDRRWCILQFDTRANETSFPKYAKASSNLWRKYAHDHNATYRLVAPTSPPFRRPTWSKWETIADYYANCDIITVADLDTYIRRPEIHLLEYFSRHYGFRDGFFMAWDPDTRHNRNVVTQKLNFNTGFVTFTVDAFAETFLREVWTCPDKIPGCAQFLRRWPTDQGAFNVLYDMYTTKNKTRMFTIGNCTLFNGSPSHDECKGEIVTHAWTKQNTKGAGRRRSPAARNLLVGEGVVVLAVVLVLVGARRRLRRV